VALRIVVVMHAEFPKISYDGTIKVEAHNELLPLLKKTGCLFITKAKNPSMTTSWRYWSRGILGVTFTGSASCSTR
jgi:hypothetical protein